jgi:hypothetical protein
MGGALELISDANDRIESTRYTLEEETALDHSDDDIPTIVHKTKVEHNDPAYPQFFKMDYGDGLARGGDNFRAMRWITKKPGYSVGNHVKRPAGRDGTINIVCKDQGACDKATVYAYTSDDTMDVNPIAR